MKLPVEREHSHLKEAHCGGRTLAGILERPTIEKILTHLVLDPQPPPRRKAREAAGTEAV